MMTEMPIHSLVHLQVRPHSKPKNGADFRRPQQRAFFAGVHVMIFSTKHKAGKSKKNSMDDEIAGINAGVFLLQHASQIPEGRTVCISVLIWEVYIYKENSKKYTWYCIFHIFK